MTIITIGINFAKNIFAVQGVNQGGHAELVKPKVSRDQLLSLIAHLPPCLISMEAGYRRTLLGAPVSRAWPHRHTHGLEICHTLPHER